MQCNCQKYNFLILVLVLIAIAQGTPYPGWETPREVNKILKYGDEYLVTEGGTCGYGPVFGLRGVVMAANTALYSDDVTRFYHHNGQSGSPATRGDGCGVCYNVSGPGGWGVAVIADICDDESACTQFVNGASFNLYDNEDSTLQVWDQVMGENNGAGTVTAPTGVTYQKITCPTDVFNNQPVGLKWKLWNCCKSFNNGNGENGSMEWTVTNHRVQIVKFEVQNSEGGEFVELERSWTNHFSAPYDPDNGNLKWWVFNQPYTVRITSVTNSIEYTIDPEAMIDTQLDQSVTELGVNDQLGRPYAGSLTITPLFQFEDFDGSNVDTEDFNTDSSISLKLFSLSILSLLF